MTASPPTPTDPPWSDRTLAAVDLGSNSFHMIVARLESGRLEVLDRIREMVRLADGLDKKQRLTGAKQDEALATLARFGERLRDFHPDDVCAVGTNTLRKAKNGDEFLAVAERALGHPIDVISGREEARLVYTGAIHTAPLIDGSRLVIDIGGGSTELALGDDDVPAALYSLFIGCVSVSKAWFPDGAVTKSRLAKARVAIDRELTPVIGPLKARGWQQVLGCSGTFRAIARLAHELNPDSDRIGADDIAALVAHYQSVGHVDKVTFESLGERRRPVFFGGLLIVERLFETLKIKSLRVADGALREGLLFDLLGSNSGEDSRDRSVYALQQRYQVDVEQAQRVENVVLSLQHDVGEELGTAKAKPNRLLCYAARLHEIGLSIAHSHYHRHGAYIVKNADLPGFSRQEQSVVAWLIGGHRQRVPSELPGHYRPSWEERLPHMLAILRIAVLLTRARQETRLPQVEAHVDKQRLELRWADKWLKRHPLTAADLSAEAAQLAKIGVNLVVKSV